jgi:hypothetical protein
MFEGSEDVNLLKGNFIVIIIIIIIICLFGL